MNISSFSGFSDRLQYWVMLHTRFLAGTPNSASFATEDHSDAIQRIYVINLDRKPDRWRQVSRELRRLRGRLGKPLSSISRRFSAVDARHVEGSPDSDVLQPHYSLADHLLVAPNPRLGNDIDARNRHIVMTPQEVAVALSHIAVWKLIAASGLPYTLVLEDDIYFRRGFVHSIDEAWATLMERSVDSGPVDLLYLSFKEAGEGPPSRPSSSLLRRPENGLWLLSGYVLSRAGAQKLLDLLPARGPIDLWLNLQFSKLNVLTTRHSIIEQRRDVPSTNSYSVLPILSQVGVLTGEKPLLVRDRALPGPVFALGESASGLTALATALAMLGYRCCSDLSELPASEQTSLFEKERNRAFNAYVNIGSLGSDELAELARVYRHARFIITTRGELKSDASTAGGHHESVGHKALQAAEEGSSHLSHDLLSTHAPGRTLLLPAKHRDKWELLSRFLGCDYPALSYPHRQDIGQRRLVGRRHESEAHSQSERRLGFDSSPWIVPLENWRGIAIADLGEGVQSRSDVTKTWNVGTRLADDLWVLRNDTFPSNLALFRPDNCSMSGDGVARLTLREQHTSVRSLTSAAIASRQTFLHGRFSAELRPSNVRGLITGMFLHRNAPRQEIDIEFLGRDSTKVLVNVYYNPGNEGAKLEFGYRGTPTLVDLGFDAAAEFHRYEIEWHMRFIRWRVDGRLIHERVLWDPTPIPDLPMQFNVNLWHSRSKELAGKLDVGDLPAHTDIRAICIL
ncbi:MAG TPA: hypothetical protein DCK98_04490 [Chloroflexi bacterium]|jgi:GR25 family glycosyltransferase involved in LPS biosynthesis|nr:hypothetical protein [Chloroflexota bacterium]HAL27620.1 hypothetical protein [Chloroflexota bacterium]